VVVAVMYVLVVYGIVLLLSPWWFRKLYEPFLKSEALFKAAAFGKAALGGVLVLLGLFVY
jgi:nitrate reductase gamma subunit